MDRVTAIYDGKVLVLQQPVDWPEGKVVDVTPRDLNDEEIARMTPEEAWEWLKNNPRHGGGFDWALLDRGDIYP